MRKKIWMAFVAAILSLCGAVGFAASPAAAADNVNITKYCTTPLGANVKVVSNWDNTSGGNGALLDYWTIKADWGLSESEFRVKYYSNNTWSAWTPINMAPGGPNWVGRIDEPPYTQYWKHDHGYSNRYELQVWVRSNIGGTIDACTTAVMSPYHA